jgi:hypothetical protein
MAEKKVKKIVSARCGFCIAYQSGHPSKKFLATTQIIE